MTNRKIRLSQDVTYTSDTHSGLAHDALKVVFSQISNVNCCFGLLCTRLELLKDFDGQGAAEISIVTIIIKSLTNYTRHRLGKKMLWDYFCYSIAVWRGSRGLTFTWWGCYGLCPWHKPTGLAHSFYSVLVSISVFIVLSTVFHSINSPDDSPFSHSVLPALWVISTIYLFYESLHQPWYNP